MNSSLPMWAAATVVVFFTSALAGGAPPVFLTVSSLPGEQHRLVEVNWEETPNATLRLYDAPPDAHPPPLLTIRTDDQGTGFFRTRFRFPEVRFTESNLTDACLFFWVTVDEGAVNCLRARPRWMRHHSEALSNLSLTDMMLPGTHNAGSYSALLHESAPIGRYLYTQEEDVWTQLAFGIRHLDLRVAYRKRGRNHGDQEEEFWITHSAFRTDVTVREVARQVRRFLDATQEIVVLDFHRFVSGFRDRRTSRARHRELIALLEEELGDHMMPARLTTDAPLHLLWEAGRRLYVGYADEGARTRLSSRLQPAVHHLWADADQVPALRAFLNRTVCEGRRRGGARLRSAMAQLTPTTRGALFNAYGGLRKMADSVNRKIGGWFAGEWNDCANIVATDFFLGNNIVEVSVATNLKRAAQEEAP